MGKKVQAISRHLVVIKMGKCTIRGNKGIRTDVAPKYVALHLAKRSTALVHKMIIIQKPVRIQRTAAARSLSRYRAAARSCFAGSNAWELHFLPPRIGLSPANAAPGVVQSIQRFIFPFKKHSERFLICTGVEFTCFTVQLVIDLPAYYQRIWPISLSYPLNNDCA